MRDLSRMLALLVVGSSIVIPVPAVAAPANAPQQAPPLDTDSDEPPLDTDSDEPPLDSDEPPLDTDSDEPPLDTDSDEPPLDSDEPPPPDLDDAFDHDDGFGRDDGYSPLRDSPEAKVARRWLRAGIAATSVGGVLVGGSIAFAMTDPCDPLAGNNCFTDARNRAALTMGVPGGVLLVGGVAMTIVGALQKRRLFFEYAGSVTAGRDHIGVVVVGRF